MATYDRTLPPGSLERGRFHACHLTRLDGKPVRRAFRAGNGHLCPAHWVMLLRLEAR